MKSMLMAAVAVCALGLPAIAQADAKSDAVNRYIAWRGGAAFEVADGLLVRGATDNGRFKGAVERRIEPGRTLEKFNLGSATTHRAYIGESGWTVSLSGQVEAANKDAALQAANRRLALFDDALRGDKANLQPDEAFDGKTVQVLRVSFGARDRYDLLLDPATGALVADRLVEDGVTTVTRYGDWRRVEGVRIAFREVQQVADDPYRTTITLTEADLNPKVDAKAFAQPAAKRIYAFADGKTATDPLAFQFYLGSRIYIPATINGAQTHVLLDSGAEATVLDKAFAESLGIKPTAIVPAVGTGGRDVAELASGVTIRIGAMELRDITVAMMDLKPIAAMIGQPLPVILGKEVFNELVVDLDFAGKTIAFQDPARFTPKAGAVSVPVTSVAGIHAIPASIEGAEPVLLDFDLGNGGPLLVFPGYWKSRNMLSDRPTSKSLSGAIGGLKTRSVATVRTLTLAGVTFKDIPTVFGEEDGSALDSTRTHGNIGMPILSRFDLTTDYSRGRILLKPRPEAVGLPFSKDRSGLVTQFKDGVFTLSMVAPGSPAEAAGLRAGQTITAVNGQPAKDLGGAGLSKLRTAAAGETLKVTLGGGETISLTLKDYY
ncbi:aspartyl protease family protein [Caulobacter sp. NIBR2454]|uniref:aspartyl protease family protein n=1 Tax=Caulobacter sp. NIBR2454 TaxID=3015996 RepID=UPI0022B6DC72|nr:aspartyl protease family protein [Caulobacter sp. NIBR2454]